MATSTRSRAERTAAAYAMYESGATLEEVGRAFGVSRERVRQIFRDNGLLVRGLRDAYAVKRARQAREYEARIRERFRRLRDVDAVASDLGVPRTLVASIIQESFSESERRRPRSVRNRYTNAELIEFLREASVELGGVLSAQGYTDYARGKMTRDGRRWPTHQTHAKRFGSWRAALKAAGLAANPPSPIAGQTIFHDGHCIDALRAAARKLGRAPTAEEYGTFARASGGALPSQATIRNRLGRWNDALARAGL